MAPRDQAKQTIQGPVRQGPISKDGGPRCGSPRSSTDTVDYLLILLANMTLWKALGRLMAPFMKIISMYWYLCGAARKIIADTRRIVVRLIGHLYAPATGNVFRCMSYYLGVVRRWHIVTGVALGIGLLHKVIQRWAEARSPVAREKRRITKVMETSTSYQEWSSAASALDELDMATMPKAKLEEFRRHELRLYDARLLEQHRSHLEKVRNEGSIRDLMFSLRADLIRNLGNMTNSKLHERRPIVPGPIRAYIDEVTECLHTITAYEGPALPPEDKLSFLRETRHAFGRTALVLSGGGALGAFHLGMVRTLLMDGLLPRVLAGSSVGSIICSLVATRTDAELSALFSVLETLDLSFFNNNSPGQLLAHLVTKGTLQDVSVLQHRLKCLIGDHTFQEAYERTGRILNVCICAADTNEPPRLLNYLTAPHAIIWSAVAASSAFPLLFTPAELLGRNENGELVPYIGEWNAASSDGEPRDGKRNARRWFDGSLEMDLPMRGLSEMFNVNYFLVSQANPHVVPILYFKSKINSTLADVMESEWKHRCNQLQSLLPDWFPSRLLTLVSQTWEGDVTVTLPFEYCKVGKAIINPTKESLKDAVMAGQRQTWAKLAAIQCNCSIEVTLDQCLGIVVASERQRRRERAAANANMAALCSGTRMDRTARHPMDIGKPPARIPSWLALSQLGVDGLKSRGGSSENLECLQYADESEQQQECPQASPPMPIPNRNDSVGSLYKTHGGSPSSFGASNPALGLPCGSGLLADFPVHDPDPVQIPFGSYTSANEFWSRLFPVAYATCLDDKDIEALDFIAP